MELGTEKFLRSEIKCAMMQETILDLQKRNMQLEAQLKAAEKENEELKACLKLTDK